MRIFSLTNTKISFKQMQTPSANEKAEINSNLAHQADSIAAAFTDVYQEMQKLSKRTRGTKAHNFYKNLKSKYKMIKIFETHQEGITFSLENKIINLSLHPDNGIRVREQNKMNRNVLNSFFIKNKSLAKTDTKMSVPENLEYYKKNEINLNEKEQHLKEIFDELDFVLLEIRKQLTNFERKKPHISTALPAYVNPIIEKQTYSLSTAPKIGKLSPDSYDQYEAIVKEFESINSSLKNNVTGIVKSYIKNNYSKNLIKGTTHSRALIFKSIGVRNEDISVNVRKYKKEKFLVLVLKDNEGKTKNLIINPQGHILKQPPLLFSPEYKISDFSIQGEYYCPEELDDLHIYSYLAGVNRELKKFNKYVQKEIQTRKISNARHSSAVTPGAISQNSLTESVLKNYQEYRKKIKQAPPLKLEKIEETCGIMSKTSSSSLLLKNMNDNGEDVILNFPKLKGERYIKILYVDKDKNIKNSFLIKNNKLLKYFPANLNQEIQPKRIAQFYSQEDIDKSGVEECLLNVNSRLEEALLKIEKFKPQK